MDVKRQLGEFLQARRSQLRPEDVEVTTYGASTVARIDAAGRSTTLLTAADGLQNPTAVSVRGNVAHVTSAAYLTAVDPNLIVTTLPRR